MSDRGVKHYPEWNYFPEFSTEFGSISFDFDEDNNLFYISFEFKEEVDGFVEGSIFVKTDTENFELHKRKILRIVLERIQQYNKSGAELQISIIAQLRLEFTSIELDSFLLNISEF